MGRQNEDLAGMKVNHLYGHDMNGMNVDLNIILSESEHRSSLSRHYEEVTEWSVEC